jgi:hypothetical protein
LQVVVVAVTSQVQVVVEVDFAQLLQQQAVAVH